jgi:hypothetical protein
VTSLTAETRIRSLVTRIHENPQFDPNAIISADAR